MCKPQTIIKIYRKRTGKRGLRYFVGYRATINIHKIYGYAKYSRWFRRGELVAFPTDNTNSFRSIRK